jgi:hypothetical protein
MPGSDKLADFRPSADGFPFLNRFEGSFFDFPLGRKRRKDATHGLCGGMCLATVDHLLAGRAIPPSDGIPAQGTPLYRYLWGRQIDSLLWPPWIALAFPVWMRLPDDGQIGVRRRTWKALPRIRRKLDAGRPVVLGLLYFARGEGKATDNHQVMAYRYAFASPDGRICDFSVYDPNHPGDDTLLIRTERVRVAGDDDAPLYGARCTQISGRRPSRPFHGFFPIPVIWKTPPDWLQPPE